MKAQRSEWKHRPLWQPPNVNIPPHGSFIVQFDKLLIHASTLRPAKTSILVKDGGQTPLLQLPQATYQTPRPVFALVAVDEDRVISPIHNRHERSGDLVGRDRNERLLVTWDTELEKRNAVLVEESRIGLRILFEDERED